MPGKDFLESLTSRPELESSQGLPKAALRKQEYCHESHLKSASNAIAREREILETALSAEKPESAKDALITIAVSLWRLDAIKGAAVEDKEDFETDRGIVENTLQRAIPVLEKHAGVTLAELGLDIYIGPSKSPEELAADVAKLKERAREEYGELARFSGAEPVSNPEEYEFLKKRLKRFMIAWKTINDLDAEEDEDPVRIALLAVSEKAQQDIADLPDRSLAVAAAKLVIAQIGKRHEYREPGGHWTQEVLTGEAFLKAIEWFGLKELHDSYSGYSDNEAKAEAAS